MNRIPLLFILLFCGIKAQNNKRQQTDREFWVQTLHKIAAPVIFNLADDQLKEKMPVEAPPGGNLEHLKMYTHLEAVGRTLAGIAPWLNLPPDQSRESELRELYKRKVLQGLKNAVNPKSKDYLNFRKGNQPIVDATFLAHAFLRAPKTLWEPLDQETKNRFIQEYQSLRNRTGAYNNLLLFAGIKEVFLMSVGAEADPARIDFARRKLLEWYQGDG